MPYGAFVDLGNGISGLVHISRICNERIKHPGVKLKEGEEVTAKIVEIKDKKISLSIKDLLDNPEEAESERIELPKSEALTTSMADLLKNIKL